MELFNKSGILVAGVLVMVGVLIGAQANEDAVPPRAVIEATALRMNQAGGPAAEQRLREWAEQGSIVAQRELAILYRHDRDKRAEAMRLFEEAAQAGDPASAVQLAAMYRDARREKLSGLQEANTVRTGNWGRY